MENKEPIKTGFEKYLEDFEERYRKQYHDKQKVIPILINLFEQYEEEIYNITTLDKELNKLQRNIDNELEEKLDEYENELLDQLRYCVSIGTSKFIEKAFIYGFCVAQSLQDEEKTLINNKTKY